MMLRVFVLALIAAVIGVVVGAVLIGLQHSDTRAGWRFVIGTFVGLVIAGASVGSLVADEHKREASGVWLGIGLWITLMATVRICLGAHEADGNESLAGHADASLDADTSQQRTPD